MQYLRNLSTGRLILWCYFIWYGVVLVRYFDPNWRLWLTSTGLSLIIGLALYISTAKSGTGKVELGAWQVIRLFMMPFCVSSFSMEILLALGLCALLCGVVALVKRGGQPASAS
jgi:hypothetical protein